MLLRSLSTINTGLGLAEHSHRSDIAATILNEAKADLASYLDISDVYEILFMQGGGSGEFSVLAYNSVSAWVARKHGEIGGGFDALNSVIRKIRSWTILLLVVDRRRQRRKLSEQGAVMGLTGLKGHRIVGGIRASSYNVVPLEGAEKLAEFVGAFASPRGRINKE